MLTATIRTESYRSESAYDAWEDAKRYRAVAIVTAPDAQEADLFMRRWRLRFEQSIKQGWQTVACDGCTVTLTSQGWLFAANAKGFLERSLVQFDVEMKG